MFHQYIHERGGFLKMKFHAFGRHFLSRQREFAHFHGVNDVVLKRKQLAFAVFGMCLPTVSCGLHDKLSELLLFIRFLAQKRRHQTGDGAHYGAGKS